MEVTMMKQIKNVKDPKNKELNQIMTRRDASEICSCNPSSWMMTDVLSVLVT